MNIYTNSFPNEFLAGLTKKSSRFQETFFNIINDLDGYCDSQQEVDTLHEYISQGWSSKLMIAAIPARSSIDSK